MTPSPQSVPLLQPISTFSPSKSPFASDYEISGLELDVAPLLKALTAKPEALDLLADCLKVPAARLERAVPEFPSPEPCPAKLPLNARLRNLFVTAKDLAAQVPDPTHPGLLDLHHVICAAAMSGDACSLLGATTINKSAALATLTGWRERSGKSPKLDDLLERLRTMRTELLERVFGQDHAVHAFVEGLFNAEVVAAADTRRKSPRAVFVFAGPPGVGKTFLAELGASHLGWPFKRFDMSAYSDHEQHVALVGWEKSYKGSHPGLLTDFVAKNSNAVLLFDEIEKAHINTIHLFLQILDAGTLEDKYNEQNVSFRDTVIIFTTNAGRKLYDRPNESGVHSANASFHRKTILDALENDVNPATRQPFFPAALCSRMATGYPLLFNHLRVNELERVVAAELDRVGGLFRQQYFKQVSYDEVLPLTLVLREGARSDARTLRSQAEAFFKGELFKFCQLFKADRLDVALEKVDRLRFELDGGTEALEPEVHCHFNPTEQPRVLLVGDHDLTDLYQEQIPEILWHGAGSPETALQVLADEEVDFALVDLWLGGADSGGVTMQQFDNVPAAARGLARGQEFLRKVHERLPDLPVFLLSLSTPELGGDGAVDAELFRACVQAGGARGIITSRFVDGLVRGWEQYRDDFKSQLIQCARRLHREKSAARLANERKILDFDTAPVLDEPRREVRIRLRNLHLTRAIAAADAGEIMEEVERPHTRFEEVIGATTAKEELKFFVDFLKNPKRFAALGLKPPKGVLLYGPPGTGKTMLARAMAGESDVAFLPASASSFVTIWQGSGPQNIRDLFARGRRYAPSIIFIDEIDAIGKVRTGGPGNQAEENTLNALLTEMDGFTSPAPDRPVFVLAPQQA